MSAWIEYAETVEAWDDFVETNPNPDAYRARWQARLRHPSWTEKREAFLRAIAYMESANRYSGQTDWPVTYRQALDAVADS